MVKYLGYPILKPDETGTGQLHVSCKQIVLL